MDWCRTGRTTCQELPDCKEDEYIASTRTPSSRRRWSNWLLGDCRCKSRQDFQILYIGQFDHGQITFKEADEKRKGFSILLILLAKKILDLRAIQGHSRENPVDPSLQDNVLIPNDFFKCIYRVGCYINMHFIIASRLIAGARKCQQGVTNGILYSRGSCGNASSRAERVRSDEGPTCCSQAKMEGTPRCSVSDRLQARSEKRDWSFSKRGQMQSFTMTFSHQSVLKEWCHQKTHEVLHTKTCRSPPPVPTVTLKDNWRKDLKIDAAASSTKPIQLKLRDKSVGAGEPVTVGTVLSSIEKTHQYMSEKTT